MAEQHGNIFMRDDGQFLVVDYQTTHTGQHNTVTFTTDINHATVFPGVSYNQGRFRDKIDLSRLHRLPAVLVTTRTVRILIPSETEENTNDTR